MLINACDAGREGELIFRLIVQYAQDSTATTKAKGLGKGVQRLWMQSMTPQAIRDGFEKLRTDEQMQPLANAARCRSEADWLVGINGTRHDRVQFARWRLFPDHRGPGANADFVHRGGARRKNPQARVPRLLGNWASFGAAQGAYEGKWFNPNWKRTSKTPRSSSRPASGLEAGGQGHC